MRSLWILTAVIVASLLLSATTLVGILMGVGFLGLAVLLMFPPAGQINALLVVPQHSLRSSSRRASRDMPTP